MDVVSWVPLVGGVVAVGVLLLLIAAVGLLGAAHHHQVLLFFVSCGWGLQGGGGGDIGGEGQGMGEGPQGWGHLGGLGDSGAGGVLETWGPPELGTPQGFGYGGVGDPRVGGNFMTWGPQGWGRLRDLGMVGLGSPGLGTMGGEDIRVEGTSGWGWVRDPRAGDTSGSGGQQGLGASWRPGDTLGDPWSGGCLRDLGTEGLGTPGLGTTS